MKCWQVILLFSLVALVAGCKSRPLEEHRYPLLTPQNATLADAAAAIEEGGLIQGWEMTQAAEDRFFATRRFRRHVIMVELKFTADDLRVIYKDSVNLNYDGTSIHKAYNREVSYLAGRIQSVARFMVPSAERSARSARPKGDSSGTGFVVSRRNHVLTNYHVAGDCEELRVDEKPAELVAGDEVNDLALLRVSDSAPLGAGSAGAGSAGAGSAGAGSAGEGSATGAVAVFRESPRLRKGEDVIVAGYPLSSLLSEELKITTGSLNALAGLQGDRRTFQISADVQPGNSGGPAMDRSGHVIGVVSSRISDRAIVSITGTVPQNINFAIGLGMVQAFLEAEDVELLTEPSDQNLQTYEIAELAQGFTLRIECRR